MVHHQLHFSSTSETEDALVPPEETKTFYEVTAENGIFKRGRLWYQGNHIDLDENTAAIFLAAGEIKEI